MLSLASLCQVFGSRLLYMILPSAIAFLDVNGTQELRAQKTTRKNEQLPVPSSPDQHALSPDIPAATGD